MINRIAVASLFFVACGDGNVTTIDPVEVSTPGRDVAARQDTSAVDRDAGEDVSTPTRPGSSSGSRLKMRERVLTAEDGAVWRSYPGVFDTRFDVECSFSPASDGKTRCLPLFDGGLIYPGEIFTDGTCMTRLKVIYHARCNDSVRFAGETVPVSDQEQCALQGALIREAGTEILAPFYRLQSAQCLEITRLEGYVYRNVLREIPPSEFVAAEESYEEVNP